MEGNNLPFKEATRLTNLKLWQEDVRICLSPAHRTLLSDNQLIHRVSFIITTITASVRGRVRLFLLHIKIVF